MLTKLVRPGDNVDMSAVERAMRSQNGKEKKVYNSKVYDVISDEKIEILMPMEQSKLILLPVDGEYSLCFYTQKGLYQCNAKVTQRYKNNTVYTLLFELTSDLKKEQRREYFRYSCILPVKTRELLPDEAENLEDDDLYIESSIPTKQSTIVDISGGGVRFIGPCIYQKGTKIYIEFELDIGARKRKFKLVGTVLNCSKVENKPGMYESRVQYARVSKEDREVIIRYIFEEERKIRQKEKR